MTSLLSTDRVTLRLWRPGDETSLVELANNPRVARNLRDRFPHPYTLKDAHDWIALASSAAPPCNFAIEFEGRAVGGAGLMLGADVFRRSAELGYWLGEPYWGKGLATEATRLLTAYAFETFDLVRIHAGVFDWNPASARVLEKAGYQLESRMRKAIVKEGRVLDQWVYVQVR